MTRHAIARISRSDSPPSALRAISCPPARRGVCADTVGFGLGWEVYTFGSDTHLMHTGMDTGVLTLGYFEPGSGSGTIVFTNNSTGPQIVLPIPDAIDRDPAFVAFLRELAK